MTSCSKTIAMSNRSSAEKRIAGNKMETSQEGRDGLPGGPLYKFEKGEKTKLGNGQKGVKISTYFVKMSFRYICALTSHFVIFCEFEFSVCSSIMYFI